MGGGVNDIMDHVMEGCERSEATFDKGVIKIKLSVVATKQFILP